MCLHIETELRELNAQVVGSLTDAEAQRLIHRTLYQEVRAAYDEGPYPRYETALARWNGHIEQHKEQAAAVKAGRRK